MTITMTDQQKTLGKGEFITIEAFYCEIEDGEVYEEERCEDVDTYWTAAKGDLMEYVLEQCKYIETKDPVIVDVLPRKWAEFDDDGNMEDYGDCCLGIERYIWHENKLTREEEFIK